MGALQKKERGITTSLKIVFGATKDTPASYHAQAPVPALRSAIFTLLKRHQLTITDSSPDEAWISIVADVPGGVAVDHVDTEEAISPEALLDSSSTNDREPGYTTDVTSDADNDGRGDCTGKGTGPSHGTQAPQSATKNCEEMEDRTVCSP